LDNGEACDDQDRDNNDGCSSSCSVETGYTCSNTNMPSDCSPICGDGRLISPEVCDDGPSDHSYEATPYCLNDCTGSDPGPGYICSGGDFNTPSTCTLCGDSKKEGNEVCDDGDTNGLSKCKADCSGPVVGWTCSGGSSSFPSTCSPICGDSKVVLSEFCDDGGLSNSDKCNLDCSGNVPGWYCYGGDSSNPSTCVTSCGDGIIAGLEACDDWI